MTFLSDDEVSLLRNALGLGINGRTLIMRNRLHQEYAKRKPEAFKSLMDRGYLKERTDPDAKHEHRRLFYSATDAGREACLMQPWK